MASTWSLSLRINLQGTGDNLNTWGLVQNQQVFSLLDTAIAGVSTVPVTGDMILTSLNGQADQSRAAQLVLTGILAANFSVTIPNVPKTYFVDNQTNRSATFTTGSGATTIVDAGDRIAVQSDGVNVKQLGFGAYTVKDYIAQAVLAATGSLPAAVGNAGKYLYSDGSTWLPRQPLTSDLSDYNAKILGVQVALAVAL